MSIIINGPPRDMCCECCGTLASKCIWPNGEIGIRKDFRDSGGCIGAVWSCHHCTCLTTPTFYRRMHKRLKAEREQANEANNQ